MDVVQPQQIITVVIFIAALLIVLVWVRRNRSGLGARLGSGRRMTVQEVLPLGPSERAVMLRADGREVLVILTKGGAPALHDMGPAATAAPTPAAAPAPASAPTGGDAR